MIERLGSVDPTVWVLIVVALALAVCFGILLDVGAAVTRYLRGRERRREATVDERTEAVGEMVDSPSYGRHVAADPEPTVPLAGSELPARYGVVLGDTSPMQVVQEATLLLPKTPPKSEERERRSDDDRRDEPPTGGGGASATTSFAPRFRPPGVPVEPWPSGRGVPWPGPTSPSGPWMPRMVASAVRVWHLTSPAERRAYRWRMTVARLWSYRVRYATSGRHDALRLCRRSWSEIADEQREPGTGLRAALRRQTPATVAAPPWMRCVP